MNLIACWHKSISMRKETLGSIWNDSPHVIGGSVFDDEYAMVTPLGVQHGHASSYQPCSNGLNFGNRCRLQAVQPPALHSSVTGPVEFLPSANEFCLPCTSWNFNFPRPVCGFPGATFTYPAYIICVSLKKAKQRPDRKGQPGRKFADPLTFFQETRWEYRCHWVCYVTEGCNLGG